MSVFITGTGTDVGKTTISAWLCLHTNATYWKPIQTGSCIDTAVIKQLTNSQTLKESYRLHAPLSPHAAAEAEGIVIEMKQLLEPTLNSLIIEGSGGILSPINRDLTMLDLIKALNIPVLVVAVSTLGTINHTCLTLEVLRLHHIPILGVIMNGPQNLVNKQAIEHYGKTDVLAEFPMLEELTQPQLRLHSLPTKLQAILQANLYPDRSVNCNTQNLKEEG